MERKLRLVVAAIAAAVLLGGPLGAVASPGGTAQAHQTHDLSTLPKIARYLWSINIDPATAVVQRGLRNYAGPSCPGAGWTCAGTDRPVVQMAPAAGGANQFVCTPGTSPGPNQCVIVQTSSGSPNNAVCTESIKANNIAQSCSITQTNTTGDNTATVDQSIDTFDLTTETGSQATSVDQTNGSGKNSLSLTQAIHQQSNPADGPSAQAGSGPQTHTQESHQSLTVHQVTGSGDSAVSASQTLYQQSHITNATTIVQKQNAADNGPNVLFDIDQESSTGALQANISQNINQSINGKGSGPVTQVQSSPSGGNKGNVDQLSAGEAHWTVDQVELQDEQADTPGSVSQVQYGPIICCSSQGTNPADTCTLTQTSTQTASSGTGGMTNVVHGQCSTSGTASVSQSVTENGTTTTNSCTGPDCDTSINCTGGSCSAPTPTTPGATVSPTSLTFPAESIGSTSPPQTVTVTSSGDGPLAVVSVTLGGANPGDFAVGSDTCTGMTLPPGAMCAFDVTFTPTAGGSRTASVSINDDAPDTPQTVSLSGDGIGPVDHITIDPTDSTRSAGESETYTVNAYDGFGHSLGDVSADPALSLSISGSGTCTGNTCEGSTSGDHTVTATYSSKTAEATLHVTPGPLDHITISPSNSTKSAGESETYTVQAYDAFNNLIADVSTDPGTTLGITDGACAGNSCSSTVPGDHTVTASYNTKSADATLHVLPGDVDHITIDPTDSTVSAGDEQSYTVNAYDSFDNLIGDVSADPGLALSITGSGSCAGNACSATDAGDHSVTATYGGKTAGATLHVTPGPFDHINISPVSSTREAGEAETYTVTARDAFDNLIGDVSGDPGLVLTIDGGSCAGNSCSAFIAGDHAVTATYSAHSAEATLHVVAGPLDHITLSPAEATIGAGTQQLYTVEAFDMFGNSRGSETGVSTFTVTAPGSCSSNACGSNVVGSYTVTADDGGKTATAMLTVTPGPLHHLKLSPPAATIVAGTSQLYTVEGFDQFENSLGDMTATTTFSIQPNGSCVMNSCTATEASPHLVTGHNAGTTGTAHLTFVPDVPATATLHIVPDTITADGSSLTQAFADIRDQFGNKRTADVVHLTTDGDASVPDPMIASGGQYVATIRASTTADDETLTVSDGDATATAVLHEVAGAASALSITADPDAVGASGLTGESTSNVVAVLADAFGNPIEGSQVRFRLTETGSGGLPLTTPLSPSLSSVAVLTDSTGSAATTYTAGWLEGEDEVTATFGSLTASVKIQVSLLGGARLPSPFAAEGPRFDRRGRYPSP